MHIYNVFHIYVASKSAILGPDTARPVPYFGVPGPCVDQYTYLGVLIDSELSFTKLLAQLLAKGWATFESYHGFANSMGLPTPLQGMAIPSRVETAVLHGIEFCINVPGAEAALNCYASWMG